MRTREWVLVFAGFLGCVDELTTLDTQDELLALRALDPTADAKVASEPAPCDFEAERVKRLGGVAEVECGRLEPGASAAQAATAERCVLDAIEAGKSFTLLHEQGSLRIAYVGRPSLAVILNEVEHGEPTLPRMFSTSCRRLVRTPECEPSGDALCLSCQDELEYATECERSQHEGCAPAGNYSGSGACCSGLHRVEQRARVFSDDSSSSCAYSPVRLFACIEGSCGDGLCEPEEAVACGCALDCPIASD